MYLAEKIGGDAAAEQIELNLLVADSYILRSELALHDQELAVNIAAYANEALWLCQTYKLTERLEDCKSKIDLAEALFCAIFLVHTNIVLRLTQILTRKPNEFARGFKLVERTLHQLFKHQSWLMIRKLYQSGILQACTQASQKLNDDSYLLQMLYIQTQVNFTFLKPSDSKSISRNQQQTSNQQSNQQSSNQQSNQSTPSGQSQKINSSTSNTSSSPSPSPRQPIQGSLPQNTLDSFSGWIPMDVASNWSEFRSSLEAMRNDVNIEELSQNLLQPEYVANLQNNINTRLVTLVRSVFDYCVEMVGDPPCPFSVFGLGSLSRGEAAPYSDLEYGFILQDEAKRESNYWKDLWTIFEFTFICFGERVGFHTDDQGSPKTPTFRGTPAQLVELFLQPLDAHDISTAFSMLRPLHITSYRCGKELYDSYISMVNRVLMSASPGDGGIHQYTKIGTLFLDDHISQLAKWTPRENDACVELKTHFLQPLVFTITDIALANGSYLSSTNAGVSQLVDGLGDGRSSHLGMSPDFARSIKSLFLACYGLKVLAQLHYHEQFEGDKVSIAQPLIMSSSNGASGVSNSSGSLPINPSSTNNSSTSTSSSSHTLSSAIAGTPTANGGVTNVIGAIYYLSREQVYWLRVAQSVVLKPLYAALPHILAYVQTNPFASIIPPAGLPTGGPFSPSSSHSHGFAGNTSSSDRSSYGSSSYGSTGSSFDRANGGDANGGGNGGFNARDNSSFFSGVPRHWAKIDPIIDTSEALVDPRFDPYGSSKPTALEETKDLIRSLVATLIFRDAPISRYRYYYKQLAADFKLLFRAAVTSHAGAQGARVQMLSYVFDSYAAPDGTRPLIERLKAHFRDHINAIDPALLQKQFETSKTQGLFVPPSASSSSGTPTSRASLGSSPSTNSTSNVSANGVSATSPVALIRVSQPVGWPSQSRLKDAPLSTMRPISITRFEGQVGYELIISLLHFSMIGYGAPLMEARLVNTQGGKIVLPASTGGLNLSSSGALPPGASPRTVKIGSNGAASASTGASWDGAVGPSQQALASTLNTPGSVVPAIFVETPCGDSLRHVLTQDASRLKLLDSKSFTELVLVNIVLMCNARADDFIFEPLTDDPRGGHRLSRFTFGQTEPSPEPIVIQKEKASLCVSNVLFCLSSMLQTVHPYAVEEFIGLSPTHLMTRLVQDVETMNKDWKSKLDSSGVAAFNRLVLPAPLPSTTSVINIPHFVLGLLFDRIVRLQKVLSNAPRSTHLDLLRHIDPIVGQFYADVLSNFSSGPTTTNSAPPASSIISPVPVSANTGSNHSSNHSASAAPAGSFHGSIAVASALNAGSVAANATGSNAISSALMGAHTAISTNTTASSPSPGATSSSPAPFASVGLTSHFVLGLGVNASAAAAAAAAAASSALGMEVLERLTRVEQRREFPASAVFAVHSTSPKLYSRIERLRRSTHAILPSSLPSTEPVFEKSDHAAQAEELKYLLMTLSPASGSSIAFPREDMLKNHSMKEKLLCSIDFAKIDLKKQRQTLLALFDSVKFTSQLRIRNCPELDHTRLSRLLTATTPKESSKEAAQNASLNSSDYNINTLKTLAVLDVRGMTGFKLQTLQLIATLENLEYLNISQTDVKSISVEKWTKREPVQLDKVIWMSCSKCVGLQHLLLRAPNLRHLDIAGNVLLTEFRVWSNQKIALIGQLGGGSGPSSLASSSPFSAFSPTSTPLQGSSMILSTDSPSSRSSGPSSSVFSLGSSSSSSSQTTQQKIFQEVPTASWFYSDAVPSSLEKILFDVVCAREPRLVYHVALNEASVRTICEVIKHTLSLEGVDLAASHIGADDLIEALVAASVANPNLKTLDLSNCGLKPSKLPACLTLAQARSDLKAKFV